MRHYINTNVTDLSLARSVSLLNPMQARPFPVLGYGDGVTHEFFFHNDGTIESWSGDASNGLRVTLGDLNLGPLSGNYTLTCGETTPVLSYDSEATAIESALNALATVISEGQVAVTGSFPNFYVTWLTTGAKTALTASAVNLVPTSGIEITSLLTGDGTHTQRSALTLRQNAIYSTSSWSPITSPYDGWSGTLSTNTAEALALLISQGQQIGDYLQYETVITVERLQPNGSYQTQYQAAVIIRAKNSDLGAVSSPSFPTQFAGFVFNRPNVVGLASAGEDSTKLGGLVTNDTLSVGSVVMLNFTVTINDGAGTHTGILTMFYQLLASTHATAWPLWGRPFDYAASTNEKVWRLLSASLDTLPASYNADTTKFHYMGVAGAANATYLYSDQTGTSAPA